MSIWLNDGALLIRQNMIYMMYDMDSTLSLSSEITFDETLRVPAPHLFFQFSMEDMLISGCGIIGY